MWQVKLAVPLPRLNLASAARNPLGVRTNDPSQGLNRTEDPHVDHHPEPPTAESGIGMAAEGEMIPGIPKEYSGWDVYNNEAKKVDTELVNDWRDSLNSLLLFAAIFAAVLTAFIIESKKLLEPDKGEMMVDVMIFLTNNWNGNHTPYPRQQFQPSPTSITINCLFFASLSASLVAALASVVALQWVADYDAAITRGGSSPEDRVKRRQFRYAGVLLWRMSDIIAALPLVVYCSVIVFLAGLTIWMWSLHYIVGLVVAGGTGLAVLFYGLSTFLSIAFVDAPFRTPLGRWIYIAICSLFSVTYRLAHILHIPSVAVWFERGHLAYTVSRKREDVEVDKRSGLAVDSLVWLANHLSISQDSYDRLLLLVGELPKLSQLGSLGDAPWFPIFDLLGWKNLKTDEDHLISKQEMQSFGVLAQLYQLPQVQEIISPTHLSCYISDERVEEYWLQCCEKRPSQWSSKQHPNRPNSLFLLLRDVPLPSNNIDGEIELTVSVSRWRNSAHAAPAREEPHRRKLSSNDSWVLISDQFLTKDNLDLWFSRSNELLFTTAMQRIKAFILSGEEISPTFLDRLRLYFESTITGNTQTLGASTCLSLPLRYRVALTRADRGVVTLHYAFTLSLARNIKRYFGDEKVRKVKEVILMLWAAPVRPSQIGIDNTRVAGMDTFFDANKKKIMTWIKNSNKIDHIEEILEHLVSAQTDQPDIGPLWRVTAPLADADPHLIEAMLAFLDLTSRDLSPARHRTLVQLLCRDIELGPPETFTTHFTIRHLGRITGADDPCLKFLAQYVGGMGTDHTLVEVEGPRKDSWAVIARHMVNHHEGTDSHFILRLQASLWPALPDSGTGICEQALRDPRSLSRLQRIFEYPVECPDHYDTEGHVLFHLLANVGNFGFPKSYPTLTAVPLKDRWVDAMATFLILSDEPSEIPSLNLGQPVDENCLKLILAVFKRVTTSQFAMLASLYGVCSRILKTGAISTEELAMVSICALKALDLPRDDRAIPIIRPVIGQILRIRATMLEKSSRGDGEVEEASIVGIRGVDRLNTHLAAMWIFGGQNCRVLSCARRAQSCSPAVGWLAEYVD